MSGSNDPDAFRKMLTIKATKYMNSKPGADEAGCNTPHHWMLRSFLDGIPVDFDKLYGLDCFLDYRQSQMEQAEIFCHALEIGVPQGRKGDDIGEDEWMEAQYKAKIGNSAEHSKVATDLITRYKTIFSWVLHSGLFDQPGPRQGYSFRKPFVYLSIRLVESTMSIEQIFERLDGLLQHKLEEAQCVARSAAGKEILNKIGIKE